MADERRARLWGLIAQSAGVRRIPVSAADACEVAAAVAGVDGSWLSVMSDPARPALVHATDPRAAELDELQFTLGEGPGTDAFSSGRLVLVPDLEATSWRERWPGFAVAGQQAGAAAIFAFPLVQGAIRIGVLGLYRVTPGSLSADALADVLVCADAALLLLLSSRAGTDGDGAPSPLEAGWADDHAQVHQATGMVSAQRDVGLEEALAVLRAHAFAEDLTLDEVAVAIVSRKLRLARGEAGDPAG